MNLINRIEQWYLSNCNGSWEHANGISIESLDNPGWKVRINLIGTSLEGIDFKLVSSNVPIEFIDQSLGKVKWPYRASSPSDSSWYLCFVKDNQYIAVGDPMKLEQLLILFLEWADSTNG